jgi:hypothetical protein
MKDCASDGTAFRRSASERGQSQKSIVPLTGTEGSNPSPSSGESCNTWENLPAEGAVEIVPGGRSAVRRGQGNASEPTWRHGADEAERISLVNRVVDGDLLEGGKNFAREMTGYSLPALRLARDAVRRDLATTLRDGLNIEADLNALAFQTAEDMAAFLEKRKPGIPRQVIKERVKNPGAAG